MRRAERWRWCSPHRRPNGDAEKLLADWSVARRDDWIEWVNQPQTARELQALRTCVARGRPFGDEPWERGRPRPHFRQRHAGGAARAQRLNLTHTFRPRGRPGKPAKRKVSKL